MGSGWRWSRASHSKCWPTSLSDCWLDGTGFSPSSAAAGWAPSGGGATDCSTPPRGGKKIVWPVQLDAEERERARRRAVREAQLAARVRHPNVVGVYDIVQEGD